MASIPTQNWSLTQGPTPITYPPSPQHNEQWPVPYGWARVYYATGQDHLTRPAIMADGFGFGASSADELWYYGNGEGADFPFFTRLRDNGFDLILIGYHQRSARIQDNSLAVMATIMRARAVRSDRAGMVVGGFSMGGLVTRYALAKMEHDDEPHDTAVYFTYDSPHRGAWIPVSLQAFAHSVQAVAPALSEQINSPAARQLLWLHKPDLITPPREDPLRTEFLAELAAYGDWPRRPHHRVAVANGSGDGKGNELKPGALNLTTESESLGTKLWIQDNGPKFKAAELRLDGLPASIIYTTSLPRIGSAPGGMYRFFGIAADNIRLIDPNVRCERESVNFVPSVSAVSIRDLGTDGDLYANIGQLPMSDSDLDDFKCSQTNTRHTQITVELGEWLLEQFQLK